MSVIPPENPRFEDQIVIQSMTQRQVSTRYGDKTVVDVKDERGRDLQIWKTDLATQAYNLAFDPQTKQPNGVPLRVEYIEKPSSDPQYPPNLEIKAVGPAGAQGAPVAAPAQQQFAPGAAAAGVTMGQAPVQAPVLPQPAAAGGNPQIPQGRSGPSEDDKIHMRRSAAIKAAAVYSAGTGADLWTSAHEMLRFIETGEDPIPF